MQDPGKSHSCPLEGGREAAGAGFSLRLSALTTSPRLNEAVPAEGFLGNPGRKRKLLGEGREKRVSQKGRTRSRSQCDVMGQVRALEPERLLRFQLHHFLCGFAQTT